ncbi:MAG: MBL fold metallo-hydrolase [Gammaproteobacteria bacterium]|nr:MBL fold metallo-hydrolase [Gammaproteobacteria bacterium]
MKLTSCGAAEEVTGSCHLLEVAGKKVLLDCGLIQGRPKDEARNRDPFPFNPADIDAVVLSHSHIDHSGRLPVLIRDGFNGPIYTHPASRDLCRTLLLDSAYLNLRDTEYKNKRRARSGKPPLEPLYSIEDVEKTLNLFRAVDYQTPQKISDDISFTLYDAGHILGSAMVEMKLQENGEHRTFVFSGDLGHRGAPILRDFHYLKKADIVMLESTYGNRLHRDWSATFDEVSEVVDAVKHSKGNVLIPAFAVGRSQMIMYMLARHQQSWGIDHWQIFLDSPMAIKATKVYLDHADLYDETATEFWREHGPDLSMDNLTFTSTSEESMKINRIKSGAIIIAGSGMCNGGRIKHHLKHNLWRKESHVIIPGYQAYGTLGRKLVDGAKSVRMWKEKIRVAATIHTVGGLSAHADQQGIMDWYANFENRPPALMVHGEVDVMKALRKRIRKELGGSAHVARAGRSIDLIDLDRLR